MPTYAYPVGSNPLQPVAVSGSPVYLFGSMPWDTQDTLAQITSVACASDVATVVCTIQQGNIPVVGNLLTVQGVATASGAYNVTNVAIASISGTASTGIYTITYACTTANLTTTAAAGKLYVPIQETSEACANGASRAIFIPSQEPLNNGARTVTFCTLFPSLPTAATVTLYTAMNNNGIAAGTNGSEWTSTGVAAIVAAGAITQGPMQTVNIPAGRWYQVVISGVSGGTSPTVICKLIS